METAENFKLTYLNNSAVLVRYGAHNIFVDGVVSHNQPFDIYSEEIRNKFWSRRDELSDIDLLLFTHCHNDHYGRKNVCRYMEMYDDVNAFIPANCRIPEDYVKARKGKLQFIQGEMEEVFTREFGDLKIEFLKTGHVTFNYPEHYAINIISEHENVIFTADMDFNRIDLLAKLTQKEKSTIFINHLAMLHRRWRETLIAQNYTKVCFYHLPSEDRDFYQYRGRALRNWGKYAESFGNAEMLEESPSPFRIK